MEVDSVADIEIRREKTPIATPSFKVAVILALIIYFITRNLTQTALIVFSEVILNMLLK